MSPALDMQSSHGHINGYSQQANMAANARPLVPGIHVPTVLFFNSEEEIDVDTVTRHAVWLAKSGVAGLAVQGSNGEAVNLTSEERDLVTRTTRRALDGAGYTHVPVIVGCGAQATREAIKLCKEAAAAGGDYALILPPSYYQGLFKADTIREFFTDVADASPIPVLIYNYPGAVSGLDLTSDALIELGRHPNIIGCKFTCGNTGKLARVAAAFNSRPKAQAGHPKPFFCFGGSGDFLLQTLVSGGSGIIGGIANIAPKVCAEIAKSYDDGNLKDAQKYQEVLARGDWAAIRTGLVGTKVALQEYNGYGGWARKPLPRPQGEERQKIVDDFRELVDLEKTLG